MSQEIDKIIYSMIRVSKKHGQKEVIKDISLSYFYGAKIGVLGLNGSGKSSLLKILAGEDQSFDGKTVLAPGYTIGYLPQEPLVDETRTVREVVEEGLIELVQIRDEYEAINAKFSEPMEPDEMDALITRQGEVQDLMDSKDVWELDSRLEMAMDALRCPPSDTPVSVISGGERRRVALCRLLLKNPDILLLDEPTNHLDAESVSWLERFLKTFPGTVIAVTHDRYFLDNVAGWILELDRGRGIPWQGNYSSWLEQKQQRLANEEKSESERQKTLARELEWIRMAPKGRHAKSKARINAYEALLSHESERVGQDLEIYIPPGPRLGKIVIEADNVSKALGDKGLGKVVAVLGDSTFMHSGITGLLNIIYNKSYASVIILDNRTTAMTGHQDNPASGKNILGEVAPQLDLENLCLALGAPRVVVVNPHDVEATRKTLKEEIDSPEPSVIISRAPCVLLPEEMLREKPTYYTNVANCTGCTLCVQMGCPAISWKPLSSEEALAKGLKEKQKGHAEITEVQCNGCGQCAAVCKFDAITRREELA